MQLTNQELVELWRALCNVGDVKGTMRFNYAITVNRRVVQPLIESLNKARELPPDAKAYAEARETVLRQFAHRDENQKPIIREGKMFVADEAGFAAAMAKLDEINPGMADALTEHVTQTTALFEQTVDVALVLVPLNAVPEMPHRLFDSLFPMMDPASFQ